MKKMSKVDTLRCALDYIRNLEEVLGGFPEEYSDQSTLNANNSADEYSTSSLSQHLDHICCTPSTHLSMTGDMDMSTSSTMDQSQSFCYSEPEEDEESNSFLQLTTSDILQPQDDEGVDCEFKLKLEQAEQYITVINMVPMDLENEMSLNPSSTPAESQHIELKLFGKHNTNEK